MNRLSIFALVLLTIVLAACGEQLSPTAPPTTTPPVTSPALPTPPGIGSQINVHDEFWYGSLSANGRSIPVGMGFLQTGNAVDGILGITGTDGEVVTSPIMSGTLTGNQLSISFTDRVGDTGSVQGKFASDTTFNGLFTLTVGGESRTLSISITYQGPLGVQMQAQRVRSIKELVALIE